jgi:hypothetical protein
LTVRTRPGLALTVRTLALAIGIRCERALAIGIAAGVSLAIRIGR